MGPGQALDKLAHQQAQPQQGRDQDQGERPRIAGNAHDLIEHNKNEMSIRENRRQTPNYACREMAQPAQTIGRLIPLRNSVPGTEL